MYHRYILKQYNSTGFSYGYTTNMKKMLKKHNKNGSWTLLYYEALKSKTEAAKKEVRMFINKKNLTINTESAVKTSN